MYADYSAIATTNYSEADTVFQNTYYGAQNTLQKSFKVLNPRGPPHTVLGPRPDSEPHKIQPRAYVGFINDYYDDEGWWALGWIKAYDLTGRPEYLAMAVSLFEDMVEGWNNDTCGGIWWDKKHTAVNAIENELFISIAAHLANRSLSQKDFFLGWASKVWSWFQSTHMMGVRYNINDGIDLTSCQNNAGIVWSYNQGVILGGLVELNKAIPTNNTYLDTATKIANAAINRLCDAQGVLHDQCEPDCGTDGSQFKGIFMRNLGILNAAAPSPLFQSTITKNADSIWRNDRGADNHIGINWAGPYQNDGTAATQSSGCDALVAAAAIGINSTASQAT